MVDDYADGISFTQQIIRDELTFCSRRFSSMTGRETFQVLTRLTTEMVEGELCGIKD